MTSHEAGRPLGYDPRPGLTHWRGTPIPPVDVPLALTAERERIAGRVWFQGPPWTLLRNADHYLWSVMDHGKTEDIAFTLQDVPRPLWLKSLNNARPGMLSKGAYVVWSLAFGLIVPGTRCEWPDNAHLRDIRPLAQTTREQLYERHRRGRMPARPQPVA